MRPLKIKPVPSGPQPHLFIVRLWWEPGDGSTFGEWRGSVEHTATHEKRYFREMETLSEFICSQVGWQARPGEESSDQLERR